MSDVRQGCNCKCMCHVHRKKMHCTNLAYPGTKYCSDCMSERNCKRLFA